VDPAGNHCHKLTQGKSQLLRISQRKVECDIEMNDFAGISAEQVLCLLLHLAVRYPPKTPIHTYTYLARQSKPVRTFAQEIAEEGIHPSITSCLKDSCLKNGI